MTASTPASAPAPDTASTRHANTAVTPNASFSSDTAAGVVVSPLPDAASFDFAAANKSCKLNGRRVGFASSTTVAGDDDEDATLAGFFVE